MKHKRTYIILAVLLCAALLGSVLWLREKNADSEPVKVILDCDMGYMNDDALSLSLLLKAEERGLVKIIGITLEGGNNFIDAPYENYGETQLGSAAYTEELLAALGRKDIPVFRGTDYPTGLGQDDLPMLDGFYRNLDYIVDSDGYGAVHFFGAIDTDLLCDNDDAAEFLISAVREAPDEIVIFAIGPTMNLAKAVESDPDFAPHVKAVYYMGGALGAPCTMENIHGEQVEGIDGANVTPVTEYNVLYDPLAFRTCITAPFPCQLVFPGSCNIGIDEAIAAELISRSGSGISKLWTDFYGEYVQDYPYWDPLTVYAFLQPEAIAASGTEYITVDADRSSPSFGRTDGISANEYEKLSPAQQAEYGKAEVVYELTGFWDYAIALLCG